MPLPKLAWDFNGTTTPYIGTATGTTNGTITYTPGKFNQAITFPNSSGTGANNVSYSTTSISVDSGITVSFWVKFNQVQDSYLFRMGDIYFKTQAGNAISWFIFNGGSYPGYSIQPYVANQWYHLSLSIGNMSVGAYLNGALQATTAYTVSGTTVANPMIGAEFGSGMNGLIDDLRIFDRALTSAQVQSIYNQQGVPGRGALVPQSPQPNLMWQFESSNVDSVTQLAPTTTVGTPTYVAGKYGQAINFPNSTGTGVSMATNYSIYTVSLNSSSGYTFAFWVNFNVRDIFAQVILSLANSSGVRIVNIYLNASNQIVSYDNGANLTVTSPTLNTGTWYHVVISITTSSRVLYLNGVGTSGTSAVTGTQTSFILGGDLPSQGNFSAWCSYDDLRVYNTALTAAQVQAIYGTSGMPSRQVLTGTPLFTQLSPAATSSAVGAFSLRAVNGVTAKAVQVRRVPSTAGSSAIQFSIIGNQFSRTDASPTPPDTSVAGQVTYNGTSQYTRINSLALTPTTTGMTVSLNFKLNSSASGQYILKMYDATFTNSSLQISYTGTAIKFEGTAGGTYFNIGNYTATSATNYYIVCVFTGATVYIYINNVIWTTTTISQALINSSYTLFGLGCENSPGGFTSMTVYDFRIMNTVLTASDIVATDFYADRLGNLLTAPVVGQSLANWLGGATGYVTTWYDQSGRGNHATQATAANQPIIQKATKGAGYSCLFNGTTNYINFGSSTILNGTNYSVCGVTRRNISGGNRYYIGSAGTNLQYQQLSVGYYTDTSTILNEGAYALNFAVPAYAGASEPVTYENWSMSQTTGIYNFSWRAGTTYNNGNNGLRTPLSSAGNGVIGAVGTNGSYSGYFSGEMFELLIFTASLFDLSSSVSGQLTPIPSIIQSIYNNQLSYTGV
jgi:hypothetical protein